MIGVVLIDGEEERVSRRPAVAVTEAREGFGILLDPMPHALLCDVRRDISPLRLEMIGDAQKQVNRLAGLDFAATARLKEVRHDTTIQTAQMKHAPHERGAGEREGCEHGRNHAAAFRRAAMTLERISAS